MNINAKTRTIHTNLYGAYAKEIINAVHGQLSDGKWENTPGYDKYWTNFSVKQLDDGEIVFEVNAEYYTRYCSKYLNNPFINMSEAQFKEWYAKKLKAVIMQELRDENVKNGWKRNNVDFESIYLSYKLDVNVSDIYVVYEQLLGREIGLTKYDAKTINRVFGIKRSADEINKAKAFREKVEAIKAKYIAIHKENFAAKQAKIEEIEKMFRDSQSKLLAEETEELKKLEATVA